VKKLIDYILQHDSRLVSPVGGGSVDKFSSRINTSLMKPEEELAYWMAFQSEEYGHEFLCSTMLDVHICKCLGLKTYVMPDGSEHVIEGQVSDTADLEKVNKISPLDHPLAKKYISCIKEFKKIAKKPVGGACFGPFTTAGGMMGTERLCINCIENPEFLERAIYITSNFIIKMALACEKAGADFFWIAEPTGVLISPQDFHEFSGKYIKEVFDNISIPGFLHIPGDTTHLIDEFIKTGAQCLSLDSYVDMRDMAHRIPPDVVILGNINSVSMLNNPVEKIAKDVEKLNSEIKNFPNFIISSGGGLSRETPEDNIKVLFEVTNSLPAWNRDQYIQINYLWHIIAEKPFDEMYRTLSLDRFSPKVIWACLEEACVYLKRQYKYHQLSLSLYSRQANEIFKLLQTEYIDTSCQVRIDDDTFNLDQLKAYLLHIVQGFINIIG